MGAVENLAIGELALQVHDDAPMEGGHAGQILPERFIHERDYALPAFGRHESPYAPFATLASHSRASSVHMSPPAQVGQAYPPVGNQADANGSAQLIVDHHLGLM